MSLAVLEVSRMRRAFGADSRKGILERWLRLRTKNI